MNKNKKYLECKSVTFYAQSDEDAFFHWIKNIRCIENYFGVGRILYLNLFDRELDPDDIRDLAALFKRYKITMKQLAPL